MTRTKAITGTVYALVDPRDGATRYIGQTIKPIEVRLEEHLKTKAPKVKAWVTELAGLGLAPSVQPVQEAVAVADLLEAERQEITRLLAQGEALLNESGTSTGRELNRKRMEEIRAEERRVGWAELAAAAKGILGGPLPPGDSMQIPIPDTPWRDALLKHPDLVAYVRSLQTGPAETQDERWSRWQEWHRVEEHASNLTNRRARLAWMDLRSLCGDQFENLLLDHADYLARNACADDQAATRFALIPWFMMVVLPWRQLAELAGLPTDDESFIRWVASEDDDVRESLEILAGQGEGSLDRLSMPLEPRRRSLAPSILLATVAAAYGGIEPAPSIRADVVDALTTITQDGMATTPMTDLLVRLDPQYLNNVYGRDVAAAIDDDLGLPAGTAGTVIRALAAKPDWEHFEKLERAAIRSTNAVNNSAVPDYAGWTGAIVPTMRAVSASLVAAGLVVPPAPATTATYVEGVRHLWQPDARWPERELR